MGKHNKLARAESDKVWRVGMRDITRVSLASGRTIRTTGKHRLYGRQQADAAHADQHGWLRVNQLHVGDQLAVTENPGNQSQPSDLAWDDIVSLEPCGRENVYDLTVPGPASWLANGIVSHNSGAIEQDADTIVFIYRDEYYNRDTTDAKGLAELIIAKQRNGPTGTVRVRFISNCTRFDNLQPGDYEPEGADFGY